MNNLAGSSAKAQGHVVHRSSILGSIDHGDDKRLAVEVVEALDRFGLAKGGDFGSRKRYVRALKVKPFARHVLYVKRGFRNGEELPRNSEEDTSKDDELAKDRFHEARENGLIGRYLRKRSDAM